MENKKILLVQYAPRNERSKTLELANYAKSLLLKKGKVDFFEYFSPEAHQILNEILDKYVEFGTEQFKVPDILRVEPIVRHGNVMEIAKLFSGHEKLKQALEEMQKLLYA